MRRRLSVLLAIAAMATMAALTSGVALAQAETGTLNLRVTQVEELENPCTGEPITLKTTHHLLLHVTTTEGGGEHSLNHFNIVGRGVSPTGAKYVVVNGENNTENYLNGGEQGPVTDTFQSNIKVLRQGEDVPEEDFIVRSLIHITTNANREVTAQVEYGETECR